MTFHRILVASSLVLASVVGVIACSSSDTNTPTSTQNDSGTGQPEAAAKADTGSGTTACTTLTPGDQVNVLVSHAPLEGDFSGGPIPDGTYHLTKVVVYPTAAVDAGGDAGVDTTTDVAAGTAVIKGTSYEIATLQNGETDTESGTLAGDGENVTFTPTCNSSNDLSATVDRVDIDTDDGTIVLVQKTAGQDVALLFKKAP